MRLLKVSTVFCGVCGCLLRCLSCAVCVCVCVLPCFLVRFLACFPLCSYGWWAGSQGDAGQTQNDTGQLRTRPHGTNRRKTCSAVGECCRGALLASWFVRLLTSRRTGFKLAFSALELACVWFGLVAACCSNVSVLASRLVSLLACWHFHVLACWRVAFLASLLVGWVLVGRFS